MIPSEDEGMVDWLVEGWVCRGVKDCAEAEAEGAQDICLMAGIKSAAATSVGLGDILAGHDSTNSIHPVLSLAPSPSPPTRLPLSLTNP